MKLIQLFSLTFLLILPLIVGCTKEEAQVAPPVPSTPPEQPQQPPSESPASQPTNTPEAKQPEVQGSVAPTGPELETNTQEFTITAQKWSFEPSEIKVKQGDQVHLTINSIDVMHGFSLNQYRISEILRLGKTIEVNFVADKTGEFTFFCSVECGQGHGSMKGTLIVE